MGAGTLSLGQLLVKIGTSTADLNKGLQQSTKQIQDWSKTNLGTAQRAADGWLSFMKKAALGLAVVGTAVAVLGAQFEQSVRTTATIAGGGFAEIEKAAREVGRTTAYTASQAANAMYNLASAGLSVQQVTTAVRPAVLFAGAAAATLEQATHIAASTMKQFGLEAEEAGRIADVFSQAITSSQLNIERLTEGMKFAGTTGAGLSWSLEETTAALAAFVDLGLEGSMAGTNLRGTMNQLLKPTDDAKNSLKGLGLTIKDISPTTHTFGEILETLAGTSFDAQDAIALFGKRFGLNILALVDRTRQGTVDVNEFTKMLQNSAGRAEAMYTEMMDTVMGSSKIMVSALQDLGITLFNMIKGPLKAGLDTFKEWVDSVNTFIQTNPALIKTLVAATAATLTFATTIALVVKYGPLVVSAIKGIGIALMWLAANPVGAVIVAVGLLIAAAVALYTAWKTNLGGIQDKWATFVQWIKDHSKLVMVALHLINMPIALLIDAILLLKRAWEENFLGIQDSVTQFKDFLVGVVFLLMMWADQIEAKIGEVVNQLGFYADAAEIILDEVVSAAVDIFNILKDGLSDLIGAVGNFVSVLVETVGKAWDAIKSALRLDEMSTAFQVLFESLVTIVTSSFNSVVNKVREFVGKVQGLIQGWVDESKKSVEGMWDGMISAARAAGEALTTVLSNWGRSIWDFVNNVWNVAVGGMKAVVGRVFNAINSTFGKWINGIITTAKRLFNALLNMLSEFLRPITSAFGGISDIIGDTFSSVVARVSAGVEAAKARIADLGVAVTTSESDTTASVAQGEKDKTDITKKNIKDRSDAKDKGGEDDAAKEEEQRQKLFEQRRTANLDELAKLEEQKAKELAMFEESDARRLEILRYWDEQIAAYKEEKAAKEDEERQTAYEKAENDLLTDLERAQRQKEAELGIFNDGDARIATVSAYWEKTISDIKYKNAMQRLATAKSIAGSLGKLFGLGVQDQAKVMIPFEIAEATKEFARFLGTRDPAALASSLKHALAAKQYGEAASSAGKSTGAGGIGAIAAPPAAAAAPAGPPAAALPPAAPIPGAAPETEAEKGKTFITVNVAPGVELDRYAFARDLVGVINENTADDVVLDVVPVS